MKLLGAADWFASTVRACPAMASTVENNIRLNPQKWIEYVSEINTYPMGNHVERIPHDIDTCG